MTPDWRGLTPAQLDAAYDQRLHAPNMTAVMDGLAQASAQVQARLPQRQRLAYGPQAVEALDWYACGQPQAPVLFFIHGGAWRNGQAKDYAFFVEWVLQAGVDVVVPDFAAVTEVEGDLGELYRQVSQAFRWLAGATANDARALHVCGHSSGAHLAACLAADAELASGVASLTLCSGLYELEPVSLSSRSSYVRFSPETVHALSPQRHLQHIQAAVSLLCGTQESSEFARQTQAFFQALQAAGKPAVLSLGQGLNHFEILQTLATPEGLFAQCLQQAWQVPHKRLAG
jgi:arylformamidase